MYLNRNILNSLYLDSKHLCLDGPVVHGCMYGVLYGADLCTWDIGAYSLVVYLHFERDIVVYLNFFYPPAFIHIVGGP